MATIPQPVVMVFKKDQSTNFSEVWHYHLVEGEQLLSKKLHLSLNRGFSKAKYKYSLKKRLPNKWSKQVTGLYATGDPDIFYGDSNSKTNMLWFRFTNRRNTLEVFYFPNFYTRRITDFLRFLDAQVFKSIKKGCA